MDRDIGSQIDTLEAKGLIRVASLRPELEYLFRHWLVQDAAYGSLLKQERRELHRHVGEAIERLYPERVHEMAGILAMHFEQADDTGKAIDYYLTDARYALERNAIREAFAAAEAAARLLPEPTPNEAADVLRRRVEAAVLRAHAGLTFRPNAELVADLDTAVPLAQRLGDPELEAQVHLYLAIVHTEGGEQARDPRVRRSLDRLRELSQELDDPSLAALPLALGEMGKVFSGPIREGVKALESAIPHMETRREFIGAAFARGWLAIGYAELGEFDRAEEAARSAREMAGSGDLIAQLDAQIAESMVRSARGELDMAAPLASDCVQLSEETGATACGVVSAWILGDVYQRQGNLEAAQEALLLGQSLALGANEGMWAPTLQAWLATNRDVLGMHDAAEQDWAEALEAVRLKGNHLGEAAVLWKRAEAAARRARWDRAFEDFAAAAAIVESMEARPKLARLLRSWGSTLRQAGRTEEGDETLRRASALFAAMGLDREAAEVQAMLRVAEDAAG